MRLVLLLLLLSGCRLFGITAARREVLNETLRAQRFPLRPDEAAVRMRGQLAVTTRCDRRLDYTTWRIWWWEATTAWR